MLAEQTEVNKLKNPNGRKQQNVRDEEEKALDMLLLQYSRKSVSNDTEPEPFMLERHGPRICCFICSKATYEREWRWRANNRGNGTIVSVKRLSDVSVGKQDFEHQLKAVGRIHHENILPLRAYYYSEEENLIVYYSVSALLHGCIGLHIFQRLLVLPEQFLASRAN